MKSDLPDQQKRSLSTPKTRVAPGPKGTAFLGSVPEMVRKGMVPFYVDLWRTYGDIVRIKMGPMVIHQLVNPEHVRHVLVQNMDNYPKGFSHDKLRVALGYGLLTSEGDLWRRQRKLMSPTYTPRGVARFAEIMVDSTEQMLSRWHTGFQQGKKLIVNQEMMRLTMSVISRSMFGMDISQSFALAGQALINILEFTAQRTMAFIDPPLFIPTPGNRRYQQALSMIDRFIYDIIHQRHEQPPSDDLLSLLMTVRDDETGQLMDEKQLRDEVLITFFAGHETTALLLTWAWYLLANHPEEEEKLHYELDHVLGGRLPTLEDIPNLPYTRRVIDETLRLYSPVAILARDPQKDDEIDGYTIPAGSLITVTPYITHRHPDFWRDPEKFDPDRFAPELERERPKFAYYPFGGGPRICLGIHFALLEAVLVIADVAQRYRLRRIVGQEVSAEFVGTLRPSADVQMTLEERP
jgi:cytochrome P450